MEEYIMMYHQLLKEQQKIQAEIINLQKTLASYPKGKLICCHQKNHYKWYQRDEHGKTYIPKSNRILAEKLAAKKLAHHSLAKLTAEHQAITAYLNTYNSYIKKAEPSPLEHPGYQELLSTFFKPVSAELYEWASSPFESNPRNPDNLIHKTDTGIYVRSKSEAMIVHFLYINKIPFRYECKLVLGKIVLYPDFTIRHPVTGEIFYWEHFGLMDDPSYCKKTSAKIQTYSMHGIIPSINLITTYETQNHPLTTDAIIKILEEYFL